MRAAQRGAVEPVQRIDDAAAKLPGPRAVAPAISPATPSADQRRDRSRATHRFRPRAPRTTSAEPAQPMAVTRPISEWPLAIATRRAPSVTMSSSPVSATTVRAGLGDARGRFVGRIAAEQRRELRGLSRTADGPRANSSRANCARPGERSMKTGSSTQGMRAACTAPSATSMAPRRSASKVPRLTRSASALATKADDLLGRDRHRRHRAGRQQHVRGVVLRHGVGDAMHARRPVAHPRENVGGDIGKFDRRMHAQRFFGLRDDTAPAIPE